MDKTALCLVGGGSHGIVQCGQLKYLAEKNIPIDLIFGSSVGALNGALFAQGQTDKLEELWMTVANKDVHSFAPWLAMTKKACLFDYSPLRRTLEKYIDPDLLVLQRTLFYVSVSNLSSASVMRYRLTGTGADPNPVDRLLASASPPALVAPVNGEFYDGGITDNYNIEAACKMGATTIITCHPCTPGRLKVNNIIDALAAMKTLALWAVYLREKEALQMRKDPKPKLIEILPRITDGLDMWNFNIDYNRRKQLIQDGYELAKRSLG